MGNNLLVAILENSNLDKKIHSVILNDIESGSITNIRTLQEKIKEHTDIKDLQSQQGNDLDIKSQINDNVNDDLIWFKADTDTLEDIEETVSPVNNNKNYKILLSLELLKDKDINFNVYAILKTLTNYVSQEDKDFLSDVFDTVDMTKYTLNKIANMIKSPRDKKSTMTRQILSKELDNLEQKGYIIQNKEPIYNKDKTKIMRYKHLSIDIPKVRRGENAIMLNSDTIKNIASVLNSDSLKLYLYLLSKFRHFKKVKSDFITSTSGIYKGMFFEDLKTEYDRDKIQRLIKGLYSLHLINYKYCYKTDSEGNKYKLYWITEVKEPRGEVPEELN